MTFSKQCYTISLVAFCVMGYYIDAPKPEQTNMQYLLDDSMPWQGHVANVICAFALVIGFMSNLTERRR